VTASYDTIGRTYAATRRADPRIEAQLWRALGSARSVLNVGAGTGSYEPHDRDVTALEPSATMIMQRPAGSAPVVRGAAEHLPFADRTFDATMGVLTIHHWRDLAAGMAESRRVAARQVFLMFEPSMADAVWLVADYFPEILALPSERSAPSTDDVARCLDVRAIEVVPVPADCRDGFGGAFWNRPECYLRDDVQNGMSSLAQLDPDIRERGCARLRHELASGEWDRKYGYLRELHEIDLGYRLVIAG
jgi:SAM-dependent methyltransferase